jgi:hypothetical protein
MCFMQHVPYKALVGERKVYKSKAWRGDGVDLSSVCSTLRKIKGLRLSNEPLDNVTRRFNTVTAKTSNPPPPTNTNTNTHTHTEVLLVQILVTYSPTVFPGFQVHFSRQNSLCNHYLLILDVCSGYPNVLACTTLSNVYKSCPVHLILLDCVNEITWRSFSLCNTNWTFAPSFIHQNISLAFCFQTHDIYMLLSKQKTGNIPIQNI